MTTFKEAQNQVVLVRVESVEGEYVSQEDYEDMKMKDKQEAFQKAMVCRAKAEKAKKVFIATLGIGI
ncbi:hypothetical protein [Acinetobacter modestus]|uniref:hypothetical protein n=1 Tax=Acinetobacter modestus TaxID=1776740 RepID=UPI003209D661